MVGWMLEHGCNGSSVGNHTQQYTLSQVLLPMRSSWNTKPKISVINLLMKENGIWENSTHQ